MPDFEAEKQRLLRDAETMGDLNLFQKADLDYARDSLEAGVNFRGQFHNLFADRERWKNVGLKQYDKIPSRFQFKAAVEFLRNNGLLEILKYRRKIGKLASLVENVSADIFLQLTDMAGEDLDKLARIIMLLQGSLERGTLSTFLGIKELYINNFENFYSAEKICSTLLSETNGSTCARLLEVQGLYLTNLERLRAAAKFLKNQPNGDLKKYMKTLDKGYRS